jgi:hypothetical protein
MSFVGSTWLWASSWWVQLVVGSFYGMELALTILDLPSGSRLPDGMGIRVVAIVFVVVWVDMAIVYIFIIFPVWWLVGKRFLEFAPPTSSKGIQEWAHYCTVPSLLPILILYFGITG